mgnify:CR=1 FL=1
MHIRYHCDHCPDGLGHVGTKDADGLRKTLRALLAAPGAPHATASPLKALVVPHAGYAYSGAVAAAVQDTRDWVVKGCTSAGIGCLECKQPVIDAIIREQIPLHERAQKFLDDPALVRNIVADGCERARKLAEETMRDVREAMGLDYT